MLFCLTLFHIIIFIFLLEKTSSLTIYNGYGIKIYRKKRGVMLTMIYVFPHENHVILSFFLPIYLFYFSSQFFLPLFPSLPLSNLFMFPLTFPSLSPFSFFLNPISLSLFLTFLSFSTPSPSISWSLFSFFLQPLSLSFSWYLMIFGFPSAFKRAWDLQNNDQSSTRKKGYFHVVIIWLAKKIGYCFGSIKNQSAFSGMITLVGPTL